MNNQNYNYGNYSQMPPNQPTFNQQPIYSQQQQQQYFNPQFANNPMVASWSYPQAQQFPVPDYSNPVGVYNVPPPPPQENQPSTFTPNQNQNQNRNNKQKQIPNNQSNRGRNKQNWTRGRGGGGRGGGSFGSGTQREIQQNQGNFKPTNNRNNRNQNQGRNNFAQKNLNSTTESPTKPANVCQPVAPSETATSQEEIDFDEQFKKWEEEFDKWKHANVNHPDKNAYRQYEQQFEAVRQKLLKRRQEMQKKKMDEKASAIKTAEQLKFESQWQAGPSQDKNKNPLKPLGESTIVTSSASSTQIPINQFKLVNPIPNSSNDYSQDDFIDESFEDSHSNAMSTKNFGNLGKGNIPGLDLVSLVPARSSTTNNQEVRDSEMICDDDEQEEEHYEPPKVSPPLPVFKSTPNRFVININEFLETPGRSKRPEKFVVFIRGAPGSGKSYLANLIQEKEVKMGNNFCTVLSINKYIISRFESSKIDTFQEELIREFRKKINENVFKFIIVEIEGGKLTIFNRFMQILMRDGNFKSFVIELNQPFDVCKRNAERPEDTYNDDPEDDDFDNDPQMSATYLDQMLKLLKRTIKEGQFRFIIVDAENVDNDVYNNFLWEGKVGKFTTYTIELHQTLDICLLQNRNKRSESDIKMAIEKLNSNRIQNDKKLLIATALYDEYKCMINPDVTKCDEDKVEVINIDDDESMSEETKKDFIDIREILEEPGRTNGFTGYAVELNQDDDICHQFNDHRRDEKEVLSEISIMKSNPTPDDQILLDPEYLYHEYQYNLNDDFSNLLDVGDDDDDMENDDEQILFGPLKKTTMKSKWDDDDKPDITMERLDGTRKKSLQSMAEYLQTDDEWTMRPSTAGKKRVRWADIEEKKAQERMRDIGFIVGQTDWNRMTDTSDGKSALEKTKYIESRKK
ncbi:CLUMA_CG011143, isoform A [Clunio marinus]|uniref:CLUMA_CG011143, isoform A n=1 Tax=Clunio marinus TaxID=568069 RepID=A0A1J1IC35_9DIPT|nr:CLUMA_CG011143, isoform A [Clunio marinus]